MKKTFTLKRVRIGAVLIIFAGSLFYAVRQAWYWHTQELSDFHLYIDELNRTLPLDARILMDVPESDRFGVVVALNSKLYPRIIYLQTPPGTVSREEWIREKKLTWVLDLGGEPFDRSRASVERIHDGP